MSVRGIRPWHLLLLVPLAATVAWVAHRGRDVREDPTAVLAALRAGAGPVLPEAAAAGAAGRSEVSSYDPDTLYEFIDGAAEGYLSRGFERCATADYTFASEGGEAVEVTAEVYRFGTPEGALGQLAAEKPAAAAPVASDPSAVTDGMVLLAVSGRDYLKLTVFGPPAGAPAALRAVASAWRKGASS